MEILYSQKQSVTCKVFFIALIMCLGNSIYSQQKKPTGKFILKESECAGFTFIDDNNILCTYEFFCNDPVPLKIRWIDKTTFIIKTFGENKECAPAISVYQIVSVDDKKLILKEIWTVNNFEDNILELIKQP